MYYINFTLTTTLFVCLSCVVVNELCAIPLQVCLSGNGGGTDHQTAGKKAPTCPECSVWVSSI